MATEQHAAAPNAVDRLLELKEREWFVALATIVGVWVFPWFLIDVLGVLNGLTGIRLGGYVGLPTLILTYAVAVVGFNLLLGYTELLSFGHAAFFGVAAFSAAIFSRNVHGSPILMVIVGLVFATLLAWPIGYLSIRRSGVYFAVLTLTFGQMLYYYSMGPGAWLTGGDNGLTPKPGALLGTMGLNDTLQEALRQTVGQLPGVLDPIWHLLFNVTGVYVLAGACTVLAVIVAHRIIRSPYGLILDAIGQNEARVQFVGLNVFRYKLMAFIISAAFTGVGGALYTIRTLSIIHPNTTLYWIVSGDFVVMNAIGGVGTLFGPIAGAIVYEYIQQVLSGITLFGVPFQPMWRLFLGVAFVLVVAFFQEGVYGGLRSLAGRLARRFGNRTGRAGANQSREDAGPSPGGTGPASGGEK